MCIGVMCTVLWELVFHLPADVFPRVVADVPNADERPRGPRLSNAVRRLTMSVTEDVVTNRTRPPQQNGYGGGSRLFFLTFYHIAYHIAAMSAPGRMIPATEEDTLYVRKIMGNMPFAGDTFAPHFRAVEAQEMPSVNAKGGRDTDGWTAVYEAIVQPSRLSCGDGADDAQTGSTVVVACTAQQLPGLST